MGVSSDVTLNDYFCGAGALGARLVLEANPPHLPVGRCLELQKLQGSHSGKGAWLTMEDRLPDGTRDANPEWLDPPLTASTYRRQPPVMLMAMTRSPQSGARAAPPARRPR